MASHRQRHPTRGLTEGAILAALTAIIAAAGLLAPPVAVLLAPLPIMLLVIRWGMRTAVLASVIAAAALFQFTGPLNAISAVSMFAPLGLVLGWGVRRKLAAQWTVLAGSVAFLLASVAMLIAAGALMHQDVMGDFITAQVKGMQMAMDLQRRLGVPASQIDQMRKVIDILPQFLRTALPVALAFGALLWAYLCYTVARVVLRRVGHALPPAPPILAWRVSPAIASVMLWTGAILSLANARVPQVGGPALDAMLVNLFVFGFQGVLVGVTWANRRGYPALLQILFGIMLLGAGLIPVMGLAILGMLDTWWDYRRLAARGGAGQTGAGPGPSADTTATDAHRDGAGNGDRPDGQGPGDASRGRLARAAKTVQPR